MAATIFPKTQVTWTTYPTLAAPGRDSGNGLCSKGVEGTRKFAKCVNDPGGGHGWFKHLKRHRRAGRRGGDARRRGVREWDRFVWHSLAHAVFVWRKSLAQDDEVLESALITAVQAGFVAVQKGEFGGGSEARQSASHAVSFVAGRLGRDSVIEDSGLHGPSAAETPGGCHHFLDVAEIDAIGRSEVVQVLLEQGVEFLAGLTGQDHTLGERAVADGVLRRERFARRRARSTGEGAVGAGGADAAEGGLGDWWFQHVITRIHCRGWGCGATREVVWMQRK